MLVLNLHAPSRISINFLFQGLFWYNRRMEKLPNPSQDNISEGSNEKIEIPKIKDANIFASFGHPHGFRESKTIGHHNDILNKTIPFKNTEFSISSQILSTGDSKVAIHFPHVEIGSNRRGGHAGLTFVFDKKVKITNSLIDQLLPFVKEFRENNFSKEGDLYRINTNDPSKIIPIDVNQDK